MAKTNTTCAECYALQQKLEEEAQLRPKTLKCFAGLCETAVPVRVGDKLIAFLHTHTPATFLLAPSRQKPVQFNCQNPHQMGHGR